MTVLNPRNSAFDQPDDTVRIFVSYSHKDPAYLGEDSLLGFLKGLSAEEPVEFWSDERITASSMWNDEIRRQLERSDIALVLVSQAFLDSPYCTRVEIESFLESCRERGLVIFPIILSPCEWERHEWLAARQCLPGGSETIEEHYTDPGKQKRLFLRIRKELREAVQSVRRARAADAEASAAVTAKRAAIAPVPAGKPAPARRTADVAARVPAGSRYRWLAVLAAATAVIIAVVWLLVREKPGPSAPLMTEVTRLTSERGLDDDPSWSPDGASVVYTSESGGKLGLWRRDIDGERAIFIGMRGVDEAQPAWSPDGQRIAFVSSRNRGGRFGIFFGSRPIEFYVYGQNGDLYVMPALGGTATKLADHAYDPSWSPDGKSIVFRSVRDGTWRLWKVSVDDRRITPIAGVLPRAIGPAWSPDGKWIAYVASANASTGWDLYVIPAAGGTARQLTRDRATVALRPAWARDGSSIIFSSTRGGTLALWRVPFGEDDPDETARPERVTSGGSEEVNPTWAPDGSSLVFAGLQTTPDLWRLDVATGQTEQLTSETTGEDYPRLSPDGKQLVFYSDRSSREEVWTLDLASREMRRLSRNGGIQPTWSRDGRRVAWGSAAGLQVYDLSADRTVTIGPGLMTAYPAYSPDGRNICFQGWSQNSGYRLYLASAAGGAAREVPTPEGAPGNPSFSPDGRTIYYQLDDKLSQRNVWALDVVSGASRQITRGNTDDAHPDVSPDGRSLLFLRNHSELHVMPIEGGPSRIVLKYEGYNRLVEFPAFSPDGRSIVFSLAEKSGDIFRMQMGGAKSGK